MPAGSPRGSIGLDEQAGVVDSILGALEKQNVAIELFHSELGPAQQELSVRHADVLRAADTVCLVRETVHSVARQVNLLATFAPKPWLDQAGSGAHIHFSLWENESYRHNSKNLFYAAQERGHLSQTGKYFIGGVLRHIRGLVALTCGSPNSYRRLLPHYWSSAYGAWGFDNREAVVRVPSTVWGQEATSINMELKCSDHSGNPYLAMGALIAAGLDGILNQIDPEEPQEIDPGNYSEGARAAGDSPLAYYFGRGPGRTGTGSCADGGARPPAHYVLPGGETQRKRVLPGQDAGGRDAATLLQILITMFEARTCLNLANINSVVCSVRCKA
jgi:glutamine synthetase